MSSEKGGGVLNDIFRLRKEIAKHSEVLVKGMAIIRHSLFLGSWVSLVNMMISP